MDTLLSLVSICLFAAGAFYLVRLKGFCFFHPIRTFRPLWRRSRPGDISPFRALTMALAGTLGVGNIVGVASALYLGGPGAVFWMMVSALVAMVLKYAEIVLAIRHRRYDTAGRPFGGAPYYMRDGLAVRGFPRIGKWIGGLFALLCVANALTMGGMLQVQAISGAMEEAFGIPTWIMGIGLALFATAVTVGGAKRISSFTEKLVPIMTVGFLVLCISVLLLRRERIPEAVRSIMTEAFSLSGVSGGITGFLFSGGLRYGTMRGLMSNEAGCGTAPMAHATADTSSPAAQGVWGLVEVFVDTILLCTVTALAILVSDSGPLAFGEDAVRTAQAAFSSVLGEWAGGFFAVAVMLFGIATVICWSHYGQTCVRAITDRQLSRNIYIILFGVALIIGSIATPSGVWALADIALATMTLLHLAVLLTMHREVADETDQLMKKKSSHRTRIE